MVWRSRAEVGLEMPAGRSFARVPESRREPPLSYPRRGPPWGILAGVPLGGPNPLLTLLLQSHSLAHGPLIVFITKIMHYNALAHVFLSVARVLLLLHLPRFPFHDSTGWISGFLGFSEGKPYILWV